MLLQSEKHPAGYDYRGKFPDLRRAGGAECASFYVGHDGDTPILVVDEWMLVELLGEELDAVTVYRFSHEAARDLYLASMLPRVDFETRDKN